MTHNKNKKERYIIVSDGGGEDIHYHLVTPKIWEEFQKQLTITKAYSIASVLEALFIRLDDSVDYEMQSSGGTVDTDVILFHECKDVFAWCEKNNVKIVGGRN